MTQITPDIIQAEIENLEGIIPGQDFHIVLFPTPDKKTTSGLIKPESAQAAERGNLREYLPIVKANPRLEDVKQGLVKAGDYLLPEVTIQKGSTRQDGMVGVLAGKNLVIPSPVTKGLEYLLIRPMQVEAFQTNEG